MKSKFVIRIIFTAILSSLLTLCAVCYLLNLNTNKNALEVGRFFAAMRFIEDNYVEEVDRAKLIEGAIGGMVSSLGDPHSVYLSPPLYSQLRAETKGSFGGIGVYMSFVDGAVKIMNIIPNSPAALAGLAEGDEIIEINGQPVSQIPAAEVANKIRGSVGSSVQLLISRNGSQLAFSLNRDIIHVKTVAGKMLEDKLGYIKITNFSESTGEEFKTTLADLEQSGMKGFVLDMRQNPGGVITSCIEVAKQIVPAGPIVSVIQRNGNKQVFTSDLPAPKFPIVVLLDRNSASAAELLSAALQDSKVAIVVGEKSFGKGSVQTLIPMFRDDGLKLTVAKYYSPNGRAIDGQGISPDVISSSPLDTAQNILRDQIFSGHLFFNPPLLNG